MRKFVYIFIVFILFLFGPEHQARAGSVLRIVTTTADLKSIAVMIGGEKVKVDSLGRGSENYHFLAAKPSFMMKAKSCGLFIRNGFELEIGYEPLILEGARNPHIQVGRPGHLDASTGITPLEVPGVLDRSLGDIHAKGNPHYWLDPANAKIMAGNIAQRLSQLQPEDSGYFEENLQAFNSRMDRKLQEWENLLAPYKGEKIITYHKTFVYFAERFGLKVVDSLEPKPGIPPSPSHLKELAALVKKDYIKVILNENIYKDDAAKYVADRTGAVVVIVPISVGGIDEAGDYFALMDIMVKRLAEGFKS